MVTKVYGTINSTDDVIFTHIDGDLWQTEIPSNLDGMWVCALYAENDSGGRAYICKVLFAITGHQMTITVLPDGYEAGKIDQSEVAGILKKLEYIGTPEERGYRSGYILCDRDTG